MRQYSLHTRPIVSGLEYIIVKESDNIVQAHVRTDDVAPSPDLSGESYDDCGDNWKRITGALLQRSLCAIVEKPATVYVERTPSPTVEPEPEYGLVSRILNFFRRNGGKVWK